MNGEGSSSIWMIVILVLFFVVIYFLMIRPRQKQQKTHEEMTKELRKGDKVITIGGIYGQIESVSGDTVIMKIESGATVRIAKSSILGKQGSEQIVAK
jgi:preprotein translocase subunit YajC